MKKIILLLALALGVEVKGQIVGGFVPINSSKSFTAGNSTFSNVIARGTLSVGSTATLNTLLLSNSVPVLNLSNSTYAIGRNNYNEGEFFLRYADDFSFIDASNSNSPHVKIKDRMFAINLGTVVPTHTLEVNGNAKVSSTFSLGSANLTGGNTGTVAVLSDALFSMTFGSGTQTNPVDGSIYYIGNVPSYLSTTSFGSVRIPYNCTLVAWDHSYISSPGSSESVTISISGTTNYTMSSTVTYSNASAVGSFSANGLSQNFNAGDVENIKIACPTWGTNPSGTYLGFTLWFVRRS